MGITLGGYIMYNVGDVFLNNKDLEAVITKKLPNRYREVKFIKTGYVSSVHISNLKKGAFKDHKAPSVHGVGFSFKGATKQCPHLYRTWSRMLERCYSNDEERINRWYKNAEVCDEWLHLKNFIKDARQLEGYEQFKNNPESYSLDKDIKGNGKLYSKDNCMFVNQQQQMEKSVGREIISISPDGEERLHRTINQACRDLGVQNANVYKVLNGERKSTLGYKFKRP